MSFEARVELRILACFARGIGFGSSVWKRPTSRAARSTRWSSRSETTNGRSVEMTDSTLGCLATLPPFLTTPFFVVGFILLGCGARTELDSSDGAAQGPARFDASLAPDALSDGGAQILGDGGPVRDGTAGDASVDVSAQVAISACLGDASALVLHNLDFAQLSRSYHSITWGQYDVGNVEIGLSITDNLSLDGWILYFASARDGGRLSAGRYDDASTSSGPDIDVSGRGAGCDETTGSFPDLHLRDGRGRGESVRGNVRAAVRRRRPGSYGLHLRDARFTRDGAMTASTVPTEGQPEQSA
jgi:hypothetical protein